MFDPAVRARMLAPEPATLLLPGIGGHTKERCEDFVVDEIPAYPADGRPDRHLLVRVRKRGLSTPELLRILGDACGIAPAQIGCAGRKDRQAVTSQWLSLPVQAAPRIEHFAHPAVEILEALEHGQKLRTGHLHGNRFRVVVRDPEPDPATALDRVRTKMEALEGGGGLRNLYGEQRFGEGGDNLERGLQLLRSGRRPGASGRFLLSALQSGLFNLYADLRREQGWLRTVVPGDLLQKVGSGGMFATTDPGEDQGRLDRGELVVTGPVYGGKMRRPEPGSASALLEDEALRLAGIEPGAFARQGKRLPGSRRPLHVAVGEFAAGATPAVDGLPAGIELRFVLGPGSYATQLLLELQCGPR